MRDTSLYKKATDIQLLNSYKELKSIWKVAKKYKMCGQSVHARLKRLNVIENNHWTDYEIFQLKRFYNKYNGHINKIAKKLNKSRAAVACKANDLLITQKSRRQRPKVVTNFVNKRKEFYKDKEFPKGMLGKKHTPEVCEIIRKANIGRIMSEENKQKNSDRMSLMRRNQPAQNTYSRCKRGIYNINGKEIFFRSSWEAMYAQYLEMLLNMKAIIKWEFETDTFWFEKIKRGVRSYMPDFKVFHLDGTIEYHEIKGWMDDKSKTKIKRMALYYPEIKLIIITQKEFTALKNKWNLKPLKPIDKNA